MCAPQIKSFAAKPRIPLVNRDIILLARLMNVIVPAWRIIYFGNIPQSTIMKEKHLSNDALHHEHLEWSSKLDFYQEEISTVQHGLQQVVQENPELLSKIEHVDEYRSILIRKKIHLEQLRQNIRAEEQLLLSGEEGCNETHDALAASVQDFFDEMESLKPTFRRFVAHND